MINPNTAENRSILKDILVGAGFDDKKVKRAIGYPVPTGFALNSQQPTSGGGGEPVITPEEWRPTVVVYDYFINIPVIGFLGRFRTLITLGGSSMGIATASVQFDASGFETVEWLWSYVDPGGFGDTQLGFYDSNGFRIGPFILIPDGDYTAAPFVIPVPENTVTARVSIHAPSLLDARASFTATPKLTPGTDGAFEVRIDGEPVPVMAKSEGQMLLSYNEGSNILDPHKRLHIGSLVEVLSTVPWSMEFIYDTNQRFTKKGGATLEDADDPQPNGKFRLPVPPPWPQISDGLEVDKTSS